MRNLVKTFYDQFPPPKQYERSMHHYPSGMCALTPDGEFVGKCRRQIFYSMMNEPMSDPMDSTAQMKMQLGNLIHKQYSSLIAKIIGTELVQEEVEVRWHEPDLKYEISGRIDQTFIEDRLIYGIEYKSTYGRGIDSIQKEGPKDSDVLQCLCYLHQPVIHLAGIYLIYIARDSGFLYGVYIANHRDDTTLWNMNSDTYGATPLNFEMIKRALLTVEMAVETQTLPKRDYAIKLKKDGTMNERESAWQCRYCGWLELCQKSVI